MRESVELLKTFGPDTVWRKILSLLNRLLDGIKGNAGVQVRSSLDGVSRSGIVNLACKDPDSVAKRLLEHGVAVSVRSGGLRISPHFYNTENEIDKLVSELSIL